MSRAKLRATILRVIRNGKGAPDMSPCSNPEGAKIYPFPVIIPQQDGRYPQTPLEVAARLAALEAEIKGLKDMLVEVRQSRDEWREQVVRFAAALPPRRAASWWKRMAG